MRQSEKRKTTGYVAGAVRLAGLLLKGCAAVLAAGALLAGMERQVYAEVYTYDAATNTYTFTEAGGVPSDELRAILRKGSASAEKPITIKLTPGTYNWDYLFVETTNLVVDATGATVNMAGSRDYMIKCMNSAENITVKGGTWNGKGTVKNVLTFDGNEGAVISNVTVDGCNVSGATSIAVHARAVKNVTMNNVTSSGSGEATGIYIDNCPNVTLHKCTATKNKLGMVFVGSAATLTDCTITDNSQDGLAVRDSGCKVTANGGTYCKNGKNGISLTGGASLILTQAKVDNNTSNGISPVGNKKGQKTTLTATGTSFNGNGRHGVAADVNIEVDISDCTASNNVANGVFLNHNSTAKRLENITANANGKGKSDGGVGIILQNGSACGLISDCTCTGNGKLGISIQDSNTTLRSCIIKGSKKHGLLINGTAKKTVTIEGCVISENGSNGISGVKKSNKTLVIKQTAMDKNGNCGLEMADCVIKLLGKGNTANDNKKHGVSVVGGKLMATELVANGNKNTGIFFNATKKGSYCVKGNFSKNLIGVTLTEGAVVNKVSNNTFSGNSKYNMVVYAGRSKTKSSLKACQKNTMTVTKSTGVQIWIEPGAKVPGGLKVTKGKGKDKCGNTFKVGK